MNKSQSKIVSKFVEKLLIQDNVYGQTYIIGLDYRVALLIILYLLYENSYPSRTYERTD